MACARLNPGVRDNSTPIFVLNVRPHALHHGALPIARSAGRLGIAVYGTQGGRFAPTALSRYMRGCLTVSRDPSDDEWLDNLTRIGRRLGQAVLVPIDDAGSVLVDDHADVLAERFVFPRRRPAITRVLGSKRELHLLCGRLGIPSPRAWFPDGADEALEQAEELGYPVVLKRIVGWEPSANGDVSVQIVHARDELRAAFAGARPGVPPNLMLQEYIPGAPDSIWMFNAYLDERSEALVAFTGRKLRQRPPYTGATSLGVCVANRAVDGQARRLLRGIGYRGIVDLGFRYDARDGRYKLLDVNPRIGATFRLFVGTDGMDVLRALYLDLTRQRVPATRQREGRRWILEPADLSSSVRYWRDGVLTPGGWLRSLGAVEEAAWFAADDPVPAAAIGMLELARTARRLMPPPR